MDNCQINYATMQNSYYSKGRNGDIDIFRAIGIICMVMGHVYYGDFFDKIIHSFHMPMFFFVSGLFQKNISWASFPKYIWHLFSSLIIPYFAFGFFNFVSWYVFSNTAKEDLLAPIKSMLWINTQGIVVGGAIWFLTAMFFAKIIFCLVNMLTDSPVICFIMCGLVFLFGCTYSLCFDKTLPYALSASFVGVGFMELGYLVKSYVGFEKILFSKLWTCMMGVIAVFLSYINGYINMRTGQYGVIPIFLIDVVAWILFLANFSHFVNEFLKKTKSRVITYFRNLLYGISIYSIIYVCLNQLMIILLNKAISKVFSGGVVYEKTPGKILVTLLTLEILYILGKLIFNTKLCFLVGKTKT